MCFIKPGVRAVAVPGFLELFLNQVRAGHTGFLELLLSVNVCMRAYVCVCVCVCPPSRLLITSGVMWRDIDPI